MSKLLETKIGIEEMYKIKYQKGLNCKFLKDC